MEKIEITEQQILSQQTENGGWTKSTLAKWGVPWPPPKGWKLDLMKNGAPFTDSHKNITVRNTRL